MWRAVAFETTSDPCKVPDLAQTKRWPEPARMVPPQSAVAILPPTAAGSWLFSLKNALSVSNFLLLICWKLFANGSEFC